MNIPIAPASCWHPACIACGFNPGGFGLRFETLDGRMTTRFTCGSRYQGYPGMLHGGVIATLVDATMTQCLFARGIMAYTAKLQLRYRHPVRVGSEAIVQARIVADHHPAYQLEASVEVDGSTCVTARASFMVPADAGQCTAESGSAHG
jgi:acyl-coenzyme A thioesterase PaaI-like protein